MIAYIDTSALVKKYILEVNSPIVVGLWNQTETLVVSVVAYAEFFSAINRRRREGALSEPAYNTVTAAFKNDWDSLVRIDVTGRLFSEIERLTALYPLRGFDAIHLASALHLQCLQTEALDFGFRLCEKED